MIRNHHTVIAALILLLVGGSAIVNGATEAWRQDQMEKMDRIQASPNMPNGEKILLLEPMVRLGSHDNAPLDAVQQEVYDRAKRLIVVVPGHADFYAKRIKAFQRIVEDEKRAGLPGSMKNKLLDEQSKGFQMLEGAPSPETIWVLGEFLDDPWALDLTRKPFDLRAGDPTGESAHSIRALNALARLPLVSKPAPLRQFGTIDYVKDIDAWKSWYKEVRAGNRTFRFEGDPQEYSLDGPVSKARGLAEPLERSSSEVQEAVAAPLPTASPAPAKDAPESFQATAAKRDFVVLTLALICGLFTGAIWYWTKPKRSNGGASG